MFQTVAGYPIAQPDQFAMDPAVSPARVLASEPDHRLPDNYRRPRPTLAEVVCGGYGEPAAIAQTCTGPCSFHELERPIAGDYLANGTSSVSFLKERGRSSGLGLVLSFHHFFFDGFWVNASEAWGSRIGRRPTA
jgi:hypothetical protein